MSSTFANLKPEGILLSLILKWIYNTYVWKRCHWLRIWAENVENIRLSSQHRSFFNLKILSIDLKNISKCVKEILFNEELEIMWYILSCGSVDTYWQQEATPFSIRTVHLLPKFESQTLKNPETRAMQLLGDWRTEVIIELFWGIKGKWVFDVWSCAQARHKKFVDSSTINQELEEEMGILLK